MSDEYSTIYSLITSLLPQLILAVAVPFSLVGIMIKFMRRAS